jgi:exodeoxyribonuclease VII large subunit
MVWSVTQISNEIKTSLLKNIPDKLIIEGEISNYKVSNGNMFFTLKDEESSISVVSWSYEKYFNISLQNGDKVQVSGKLACYSKNGTYSMQIFKIEKQGVGNLHTSYEKQKQYYQDKGYFSENTKKQFPTRINNIGIITSPEGAAIQDILFVLNKNKFQGKVFIKRCMVQGNMCAKSIADSIEYMNNFKTKGKKKLDLILVTRGGGSFEDLMGYSDQKVIEAIYDSDIYVISAVGHEIDFMLSDFVADLRAPTPSIAAETISKKQKENIDRLTDAENNLNSILKNKILNILNNYHNNLDLLEAKNKNPLQMLELKIDELNTLQDKLTNSLKHIFTRYFSDVNNLEKNLEKFNMKKNKDFGLVQVFIKNDESYKLCKSIEDFSSGKNTIKIVLEDGEVIISSKKIDIKSIENEL